MKVKNILIGMLACMSALAACDPIEDESLRDDYQNAGTPITKEELQAAISVTQPYPNQEGVVEGDQYVVLKNSRPDVGGVWHKIALGDRHLAVAVDDLLRHLLLQLHDHLGADGAAALGGVLRPGPELPD